MRNEKYYAKALSKFGFRLQSDKMIEEMAEAIVAIQHWKIGRTDFNEILTELSHVELMIKQMIYLGSIIHCENVWRHEQKLVFNRLVKLLKSDI